MSKLIRTTIATLVALTFSTSAMALHHQKGHKQGGGQNGANCSADVTKKSFKGHLTVISVEPNAASTNAYKGKGDQGKGAPVLIRIIPGVSTDIIRGGKKAPHKSVGASKGTDSQKLPHLKKCSH